MGKSADTLWQRAYWQVAGEVKRDQQSGHGNGTLHLKDVDNLVIEWSKMDVDEMIEKSEEYK